MAIRIPSAAIGLATGFVQGFTRNIQTEQGIRFKEQERLDRVTDAITAAILDPGDNFNSAAVKALQASVQETQKEMDERGNIDIFGRAGPRINIDYDNVLSTINSIGEKKLTLGGFALGPEIDFKSPTDYGEAVQLLNWGVTTFAGNPANLAALGLRSDNEILELNSAFNSARRIISVEEVDTKNPGVVKLPDLSGKGDLYYGLDAAFDIINARLPQQMDQTTVSSNSKLIPTDQIEVVVQKAEQAGNQVTSVGQGVIQDDGQVSHLTTNFGGDAKLQAAHDELAAAFGFEGPQKKGFLTYWQNSFMNIPGDPNTLPQYTLNAFEAAVEFGTMVSNPKTISIASLKDSIATEGGAGAKLIFDALNDATIANGSDLRSRIYALAPHLPGKGTVKAEQTPRMIGDVVKIAAETVQQYILGKIYGTGPDAPKPKFKEFMDQRFDLETVTDDLDLLKEEFLKFVIVNDDGSEKELSTEAMNLAYESFKKKLKVVFDVNQGILGGLVRDIGGAFKIEDDSRGRLDLDNAKQFTTEYKQYLENRVKKAGGTSQQLARLEAMRISLAFKMARAADPSGRLSNQDIEIQLTKLGANFSTISDAIAGLNVSIQEFKRKQQQYAVFERYIEDDSIATKEDYQIINAAIAVDFLDNRRNLLGKQTTTTSTTQEEAPVVDLQAVANEIDSYFIMSDGRVVKDIPGATNPEEITDSRVIAEVKRLKAI